MGSISTRFICSRGSDLSHWYCCLRSTQWPRWLSAIARMSNCNYALIIGVCCDEVVHYPVMVTQGSKLQMPAVISITCVSAHIFTVTIRWGQSHHWKAQRVLCVNVSSQFSHCIITESASRDTTPLKEGFLLSYGTQMVVREYIYPGINLLLLTPENGIKQHTYVVDRWIHVIFSHSEWFRAYLKVQNSVSRKKSWARYLRYRNCTAAWRVPSAQYSWCSCTVWERDLWSDQREIGARGYQDGRKDFVKIVQ